MVNERNKKKTRTSIRIKCSYHMDRIFCFVFFFELILLRTSVIILVEIFDFQFVNQNSLVRYID